MSKNGAKLVRMSQYVATAMLNELMCRAIKMSEIPKKNEVQKHGFTWEGEVIRNVYKCMTTTTPYTGAVDLPAHLNNLEACRVSIKTTGLNQKQQQFNSCI